MFEKSAMLYLTVETPLHAGSGTGLGVVDLPIQRERTTGFPMVQGSGIKGKVRAEFARKAGMGNYDTGNKDGRVCAVFGPDTGDADKHAGALAFGDARLLLFPVRSLVGVFAWTTSYEVLARFARDLKTAGITFDWEPLNPPDERTAFVTSESEVSASEKIALEEFAFTAKSKPEVTTLAQWLVKNILPTGREYAPWRTWLPKRLVILPSDAFRDFTQFSTEVISRIQLISEKKVVDRGALWTEEHLPTDTILYAPLYASRARAENAPSDVTDADKILTYVKNEMPPRLQLGGDETVGRGLVATRVQMLGNGGGQDA
ncbi:MAG TPA: type III-B CRISPR module RAMP protein Cmr4 [Anaerolineae bacterium]|nr:type III-B CRISPR module RAMP protein Cmr4 [Anaerolineae bacterium]